MNNRGGGGGLMSAGTKEPCEDGRPLSHPLLVIHCYGGSSDGGSVPGVDYDGGVCAVVCCGKPSF